jgi:hypothetical protein
LPRLDLGHLGLAERVERDLLEAGRPGDAKPLGAVRRTSSRREPSTARASVEQVAQAGRPVAVLEHDHLRVGA